jgi:hypothetical protein
MTFKPNRDLKRPRKWWGARMVGMTLLVGKTFWFWWLFENDITTTPNPVVSLFIYYCTDWLSDWLTDWLASLFLFSSETLLLPEIKGRVGEGQIGFAVCGICGCDRQVLRLRHSIVSSTAVSHQLLSIFSPSFSQIAFVISSTISGVEWCRTRLNEQRR